jgi:hypothetical protein
MKAAGYSEVLKPTTPINGVATPKMIIQYCTALFINGLSVHVALVGAALTKHSTLFSVMY